MKYPKPQELESTFRHLSRLTYKGVKGVFVLKGIKNGKTIIISILTHGNEINSLAAAWYIMNRKKLLKLKIKGKIIITLNNIEAGKKYFDSLNLNEKLNAREKDIDMNRLPKNILKQKKQQLPYEIKRVNELYKVWKEADAGLDLHGTDLPSQPMIIDIKGGKKMLDEISAFIPIRNRLTNITMVQEGQPVGALFGGINNNKVPVIEIESGANEDPKGTHSVIEYTNAFLRTLSFKNTSPHKKIYGSKSMYKAIGSVILPNSSYHLVKKMSALEVIKKGQTIAEGNAKPIISKSKCYALFPPAIIGKQVQKRIIREELFLAKKIKIYIFDKVEKR